MRLPVTTTLLCAAAILLSTGPAFAAEPDPVAAGCGKDTDCKGERICVAHECVDPPPGPAARAPQPIAEPVAEPVVEGPPPVQFNLFGGVLVSGGDRPEHLGMELGAIDLFGTARLSSQFTALAEVALEVDERQEFSLDVERLQLTWRFRDWLQITAGRIHAALGYYNAAYHHGQWLEVPVRRPRVVAFEDHGGLLPVHLIGFQVAGRIARPSIEAGYAVEVGNGRGEVETAVIQFQEQGFFKSVNVQAWVRFPTAGLRLGGNAYFDHAPAASDLARYPLRAVAIDEQIYAAHLQLALRGFSLLGEYYFLRHKARDASAAAVDHGWFAIASYAVKSFEPYVLAGGVHFDPNTVDLFYSPDGAALPGEITVSGGVKWWLGDMLALKAQYDHVFGQMERNVGSVQAAFGF